MPPSFDIATLADDIAGQLRPDTHLFGWSLGGVVAQWIAAHYPEKVKSLTLCATFAKLFAAPDYDVGLRQSALHKMLPLFQDDYPKHMRQFLELQLLHTARRKAWQTRLPPSNTPICARYWPTSAARRC